jgi:hypothetical protein
MPWLSRVNFIASDTLSFTDVNNLGNDIRAWGDNVNGGGYTLSNVVVSASAGTMPTVTGGSAASSTLTLRSTSGAGTTDAIIFQTGTQVEQARITTAGRLGIGTSSPTGKLDVVGGRSFFAAASEAYALGVKHVSTGGAVYFGATNGTASPDVQISNAGGGALMTLMNGGNVGIGTTSPAVKLQVAGASSTAVIRINSTDTSPADLQFTTTQGTAGIGMGTVSGTGFTNNLQFSAAGFHFITGNVGIGTTNPTSQLQLSTDSAAKPTTNTWTIASDSRLKTVKGEYTKGLAEICQVRPIRYHYNGKGGFTADGKEQISILAQELVTVFPECVGTFKAKLNDGDEEETELLNYNGHAITFALVNAIKELKAEIDTLKSEAAQ